MTLSDFVCIIMSIFGIVSVGIAMTFIFATLIRSYKDGKSAKENIKEAIHELTEQEKAEIEWQKAKENARHAWNEIAHIEELTMRFYEHDDWLLGKMQLCYEIEKMPLYLKPFKCSMEKKPWNRPELDEVISVIIFARDMESIVDYMNCYQYKDPDASGFEMWSTNYLYDGMSPLRPCENLTEDIKHAQKAFIIDYTTGWKYKREKKAREAA